MMTKIILQIERLDKVNLELRLSMLSSARKLRREEKGDL
jgi:hypothetical protein